MAANAECHEHGPVMREIFKHVIVGFALVSCARGSIPTTPQDPAPPVASSTLPTPSAGTTPSSAPTDDELVANAVARLGGASATPVVVFLSTGEGARAARAASALQAALERTHGVALATASNTPGAPVADSNMPGGHVNTQQSSVNPWPTWVVRVSELGATLYIAARPPGRDPLGPPENGWTWVLSSP